jgi:hypothetical protein
MEPISHTATTEKGNVSLASVNTPAKFELCRQQVSELKQIAKEMGPNNIVGGFNFQSLIRSYCYCRSFVQH